MSSALVEVKFKDGLVLYTQYNGTADIFQTALFFSADEAWKHKRWTEEGLRALWSGMELESPEEVEIFCHYGGGSNWTGLASRKSMNLEVKYPEGWFSR